MLKGLLAREAFADMEGLHGTTLFGTPAERFGFDVTPSPHTTAVRLERYFMAGLFMQYHPDHWNALHPAAQRWPYELWLDRATLMRLA